MIKRTAEEFSTHLVTVADFLTLPASEKRMINITLHRPTVKATSTPIIYSKSPNGPKI